MSDSCIEFYTTFEDFYSKILNDAENNILNTPFQYKAWQSKLYAEHKAVKPHIPYFGAILYNNGAPILGGHFFIKRSGRHRGVFLLGSGGETDYYDLIYFCNEVKTEHINELLKGIEQRYPESPFTFMQVPEGSPLAMWAKENGYEPYFTNECAEISFSGTYEDYFSSLSKSVRQNIRTAKNRLAKDNSEASIQIYNGQAISNADIKELLLLYESRRKTKNNFNGLAKVKYRINEYLRKRKKEKYHLIKEALCEMEGSFAAIYKIDQTIGAYCFGLKSKCSEKICIMQVAINDDYGKYSPGMLMLTSVFELLLNKTDSDGILFDLTNGNEKYKYYLGATSHYTNYYRISLNK